MSNARAIVFCSWGEEYIREVLTCIDNSPVIQEYDILLVTDTATTSTQLLKLYKNYFSKIISINFELESLFRKVEFFQHLPNDYKSFLFLDTDVQIIKDIHLGFQKAEQFGIAISPAPFYSLDYVWYFDKVMHKENIPLLGQLQYNTGVIFFSTSNAVKNVFNEWMNLVYKYKHIKSENDQPFFTLAMEKCEFNPYTLSISYNYRAKGEKICGPVRIWHSHKKMPNNINKYKDLWPPRRALPNKMIYPNERKNNNAGTMSGGKFDLLKKAIVKIKNKMQLNK